MSEFTQPYSPLEKLNDSFFEEAGVELFIKREDLIHPLVSGNKWRKLKYNLIEAKQRDQNTILSFGGAYSNHIYALAAAGSIFHFKTIGVIRGELTMPLNPTLQYATQCGMQLHYIDRDKYRQKEEKDFLEDLRNIHGEFYYLPEGGSNELGVKGCAEIIKEIDMEFDYITTACGSGGTLAGLITGLKGEKKAMGFSALKGKDFLNGKIEELIGGADNYAHNWAINYDYHFGGYAKLTRELVQFMNDFEIKFKIKLEPVYTAKMFFGLFDLIKNGFFKMGTRIIALHTRGLQGLEGMKEKMRKV
ncbi:MAG: pyridoxal-phosphate dependent enzyme [Cytophagaceae bacterium]|nr:pyridoxal-phosphate dependent enzyme [Cytophagaceae bacterium]